MNRFCAGALALVALGATLGATRVEPTRLAVARLQYEVGRDWSHPSRSVQPLKAINGSPPFSRRAPEGPTLADDRLADTTPDARGTARQVSTRGLLDLRDYRYAGFLLGRQLRHGRELRREIARSFHYRPMVDVPLTHPTTTLSTTSRRGSQDARAHNLRHGLCFFHRDR